MAVLTLALGTGANAAVFSFVDALLFKSGAGHPSRRGRWSRVYTSDFSSGPYGGIVVSRLPVAQVATRRRSPRSPPSTTRLSATLRVGDDLQRVRVARVSGEYFDALGVRPSLGRPLDRRRHRAVGAASGGDRRRALAARVRRPSRRPSAPTMHAQRASRSPSSASRRRASPASTPGAPIDVWTPLDAAPARPARGNRGLAVLGQLRDGVSPPEAQAQLDDARRDAWRASIRRATSARSSGRRIRVRSSSLPATRIVARAARAGRRWSPRC